MRHVCTIDGKVLGPSGREAKTVTHYQHGLARAFPGDLLGGFLDRGATLLDVLADAVEGVARAEVQHQKTDKRDKNEAFHCRILEAVVGLFIPHTGARSASIGRNGLNPEVVEEAKTKVSLENELNYKEFDPSLGSILNPNPTK
jgi:hypothetical protein